MRLLIVENELELGCLLLAGLQRAGYAADQFVTLGDAEAALATTRYDAVILDLGLPDGEGTRLLTALRRCGNGVPVLILTARDAVADRVRGLDAGADDYLLKPFHMDELVARIKALLRRPNQALGVRLEIGNLAFDSVHRAASVADRPLPLTRRELGLVEMLMRRAGRVVTREAIEDGLYSFNEPVGSNAVEVLVHRLRRKLDSAGAAAHIHTLRGVGYMLEDIGS